MDRGAWKAAVHGVAEGRTRLSNFTFTFHFHVLEKEMTTHSSVLAWRISRTGEPGGLPSMGSQRVGHDWSDLAATHRSINSDVLTVVTNPYPSELTWHFTVFRYLRNVLYPARMFVFCLSSQLELLLTGFSSVGFKFLHLKSMYSSSFLRATHRWDMACLPGTVWRVSSADYSPCRNSHCGNILHSIYRSSSF